MSFTSWIVSKLPPRFLNVLFYSKFGKRLVAIYERSANKEIKIYDTKFGVKFLLSAAVPGERAIIYNAFEPKITKLFLSLVSKNSIVFDIGSWVGYYAILAAKQGAGQIFAVELDPENSERIRENANINGFENIKILHAGVSDKKGRTIVERRKDSRIMAHIVGEMTVDGIIEGDVAVETLDDIAGNRTVDLAMIDIEGHEFFALKGAQKLLNEKRLRKILIEVHPNFLAQNYQSADELTAFLDSFGYSVKKINAESPTVHYILAECD
jgi:FkbM family methyltransferase